MRAGQRQALDIYLWSRAAIWIAAIFAFFFFEPNRHSERESLGHAAPARPRLLHRHLGALGQRLLPSDRAERLRRSVGRIPPALPGTVAVLGRVFFGHYVLAGLVDLAALLPRLVRPAPPAWRRSGSGAEGAERSVLYLAVFPMSPVPAGRLQRVALPPARARGVRARRAQPLRRARACVAGLAILTRAAGLALLPALALLAWRHRDRLRALGGVALALPVAAIYPLVLWQQVGDPWAFCGCAGPLAPAPLTRRPVRWDLGRCSSRRGAASNSSSSATARTSRVRIRCTQRRRTAGVRRFSCSSSRSPSSPGGGSVRRTGSSPR